jgi:hypothetical protein
MCLYRQASDGIPLGVVGSDLIGWAAIDAPPYLWSSKMIMLVRAQTIQTPGAL